MHKGAWLHFHSQAPSRRLLVLGPARHGQVPPRAVGAVAARRLAPLDLVPHGCRKGGNQVSFLDGGLVSGWKWTARLGIKADDPFTPGVGVEGGEDLGCGEKRCAARGAVRSDVGRVVGAPFSVAGGIVGQAGVL